MVPLLPYGDWWEQAVGKRVRWYCICLWCTAERSWLPTPGGASYLGAWFVCILLFISMGGRRQQTGASVGQGFLHLVVIHLWAPCSLVFVACCLSVIGGNTRHAHVGGGDVADGAVI